ncbi:MAG: hypothetical protein OK454_05995, partial [Thaumarchaeota archaeon]|nr:hypothetical protein [Nitrososphaerota archaeon]
SVLAGLYTNKIHTMGASILSDYGHLGPLYIHMNTVLETTVSRLFMSTMQVSMIAYQNPQKPAIYDFA